MMTKMPGPYVRVVRGKVAVVGDDIPVTEEVSRLAVEKAAHAISDERKSVNFHYHEEVEYEYDERH